MKDYTLRRGYEFDTFKLHKGMLVLLIATIWVFTIVRWIIKEHNNSVIYFVIAFVVYLFLSFCVALLAFVIANMRLNKTIIVVFDRSYVKKIASYLKISIRCISITFLRTVTFFISPSWLWSDIFKINIKRNTQYDSLKVQKVVRKEFIAYKNLFNIGISVLLIIIAMYVGISRHPNSFGCLVLVGLIFYRVLSRSLEIILAFGDDAFTIEKKSTLKSSERLILSITSLFECILNYTLVYYFMGNYASLWEPFINSLQCSTLYTCVSLSEPVCCSISNMYVTQSTMSWLQITQMIASLTLIFLSLAIYISGSRKNKNNRVSKISLTTWSK